MSARSLLRVRSVPVRAAAWLRCGLALAATQAEVAATADTVCELARRAAASAGRDRCGALSLQPSLGSDVSIPAARAVRRRAAKQRGDGT